MDPSLVKIRGGKGKFAMLYGGNKLIGLLTFSAQYSFPIIEEKKRLGTLFYLYATQQIYDESDKVLRMSFDVSESARAVWKRLIETRFAAAFSRSQKAFLKPTILSNGTLKIMRQFADLTPFDPAQFEKTYRELLSVNLNGP